MKKSLKRFVDWATGSRPDPFRSARWKLTAVYCAILAVIVGILSASLYEFHSHDVDRLGRRGYRAEQRLAVPGPVITRDLGDADGEPPADVAEYLERLGRNILVADLITLLVGGALSAFLAGRTLRPIRSAVESEKQFYANAAHDLRTPLAVMRSEAEVALRSPALPEAEARRIVKSSLEEIDHMSVMVEQMLDLARGAGWSGTDRQSVPRGTVDLSVLARGMVEKTRARAEQQGVQVTHHAAEPAGVRGDEHALQRALGNLLANALTYTPSGGTVDVSVEKAHGHVTLRVKDTGIGIPPADLPHITEPFFRGDRARGVHPGGAGLGLTIVKDTVASHGGTFQASCGEPAGTTITLRFPAL